jgi:hypothetical protein
LTRMITSCRWQNWLAHELASHCRDGFSASLSLPPACGTCWFAPKICSNAPNHLLQRANRTRSGPGFARQYLSKGERWRGVARRGGGLGASDQILGSSGFLALDIFGTVSYACAGYPLGTVGMGWTAAAGSLPSSHSGMFSIATSDMLISSRAGGWEDRLVRIGYSRQRSGTGAPKGTKFHVE